MKSVGSHCYIELGWQLSGVDRRAGVNFGGDKKVCAPSFNGAAACGACRGGGVLVNIAFVWLLLVK